MPAKSVRPGAAISAADLPNRIIVPAASLPRHRAAAMAGAREVNLAENPLAWLVRRGHLTPRQFEAGERLRCDHELALSGARTTMRWDATPVARGPRGPHEHGEATLAQIAARRRRDGALAAAGGGLADVLTRVVCEGEGLETAERALAWPARSAKLVLGFALDRVADYHGI